jgi:hypothetical protein
MEWRPLGEYEAFADWSGHPRSMCGGFGPVVGVMTHTPSERPDAVRIAKGEIPRAER